MLQQWGNDEIKERESWAVPLGLSRGYLAIATTRCVVDYRYPLGREMRKWSNLALFSVAPPTRPDVRREVFRIGSPAVLPGVVPDYDPKWDGIFFTSREYLAGSAGDRYFGMLKTGRIPSGAVEPTVGDLTDMQGADLVIVHLPLADPGVNALVPARNLGMREPAAALRAVLAPRTSLWADTFRFELVSQECMNYARADYKQALDDASNWRALAIAAGVALAAVYLGPTIAAVDAGFVERLGRRAAKEILGVMWRSATEPLLGTSSRSVSWNSLGKLVLRLALSNGSVRDYMVAGISRLGLSDADAQAIADALVNLLQDPATRVATLERSDGPPVASVMVPHARLDFSADLIRRGVARLDPFDVATLAQQPTLVDVAQQAIADPDVRSDLIRDEAYRRAVRDISARLAQ